MRMEYGSYWSLERIANDPQKYFSFSEVYFAPNWDVNRQICTIDAHTNLHWGMTMKF